MALDIDPPADLAHFIDRAAISELVDRYSKLFDDRTFSETLPTLFTDDAFVELPSGEHRGLDGLDKFHEHVMTPFGPTQHLFTNTLVDTAGERASFRTNTYVTHTVLAAAESQSTDKGSYFLAGGTLTGTVLRTTQGWRFEKVVLDVIWRQGNLDFRPQ
ncbi:nuclear transport factor 2 family protein [Streptacidiphilus sp. N1-10]|uniref:Nuclear transport factor 2 family protein n=1 Tax=Streptacidiphilus jeojiensis TaxID=3229225 RepID=A0ABV6XFX4_9ACTN